jgi:phage major head subunit gpT-like protein
MAIVSTGLTLAALKGEFFQRLDATPTVFQDLSTRIQSNTAKESYRFLGSVPPMREWGTGRLARGMIVESYDIENQKYEITVEVDRDEVSDDQLGQIRIRIGEMAERAAQHKDSEIARLLINGATAGYHSYDGVPFFAATHVSGASGTQSNPVSLDAADHTNVTTAEFQRAMRLAIAKLLSLKDDQGEPMNQAASGLIVVVPPALYMTALEAMSATLVSSTSNILQGAARVLAFSYLTDGAKCYVLKTDVAVRPLIFQDREPIEFKAMEADSESGFRREVYEYGVRARYRMTYGYWQRAVQVTFT